MCPFCNIGLDKEGKHFCTAVREPEKAVEPAKNVELERIIDVLTWAQEKGALHFKCPYFEMVFAEQSQQKLSAPTIVDDNAKAEAGITEPVPFKNPIDDPDYYAVAQERFFNHQRR